MPQRALRAVDDGFGTERAVAECRLLGLGRPARLALIASTQSAFRARLENPVSASGGGDASPRALQGQTWKYP